MKKRKTILDTRDPKLLDQETGNEFDIRMLLYEKLWEVFHRSKVLIPIHHETSRHYSLLMIDLKKWKIIHMNSSLPKKGKSKSKSKSKLSSVDKWLENAKAVVSVIKRLLYEVSLIGCFVDVENQDPNELREKTTGMMDGQVEIQTLPMSDDEKATRKMILEQKIDITIDKSDENKDGSYVYYTFEEDKDCPQQIKTSEDCGPFMLHFIKSLVNGKTPIAQVGKMRRTKMIERFMILRIS